MGDPDECALWRIVRTPERRSILRDLADATRRRAHQVRSFWNERKRMMFLSKVSVLPAQHETVHTIAQ
jgi:hypothetical protein